MLRNRRLSVDMLRSCIALIAVGAMSATSAAWAGSFDGGYLFGHEISGTYKVHLGYGLAIRTENPSNTLINGPVDHFHSALLPSTQPGQPAQVFRFTHTGLPTTINFDDGDRNFKKWSLTNNRVSAFTQFHVHWGNFGVVASASAFYDQAYHHPNANHSAATVNQLGPNGEYPTPTPDRFTSSARHYDGARVHLLEAYGYGDWYFGSQSSLDVRVGRQLVAWGQSLFFTGLALSMSRANSTISFVPGAQVKDILLPTNQVAIRLGITSGLTFLADYKLNFNSTELFPQGDYFSPSDAIGPGATFIYGSANPLIDPKSCPDLVNNLQLLGLNVGKLLNVVPILGQTVAQTFCGALTTAGKLANAVPFIKTTRLPDDDPSDWGQWGLGVEYQLTDITSVGFHFLRYADNNPAVMLHVGYAPFTKGTAGIIPPITTQIINQPVPVAYNIKYFGGIHLYNVSFSTVLGAFNVGGEINYRDGVDAAVAAKISGVDSPIFTRAKVSQALLSGLYVTNPNLYFDDLVFTGEVGYVHVNSIDRVKPSPGIEPLGDGRSLFYSKNSWGFETLIIPTKHNFISGWDLSMPISYSMIVIGNPSLAGAFGALYGQGDKRLGVGISMQYLQNFKVSLGYSMFFGNVNKLIKQSTLHANPYVDRNYASLSLSYNLF